MTQVPRLSEPVVAWLQGIELLEYTSGGVSYTVELDAAWGAAFVYVDGAPAHEVSGGADFSVIPLLPSQE